MTIPWTQKYHQFVALKEFALQARSLACFCTACWEERPLKCVNCDVVGQFKVHKCKPRLQKELKTLMFSGSPGISAFPDGDNLFKWIGTIEGAKGTVYEGLSYKLCLTFPSKYPMEALQVKFVTPCYHPNVDQHGNICLDILKEKWSALYDVRTILLSLQSLLGEPNIASPLNTHAADLWKDQEQYKKVLVQKYKDATKSSHSEERAQKHL